MRISPPKHCTKLAVNGVWRTPSSLPPKSTLVYFNSSGLNLVPLGHLNHGVHVYMLPPMMNLRLNHLHRRRLHCDSSSSKKNQSQSPFPTLWQTLSRPCLELYTSTNPSLRCTNSSALISSPDTSMSRNCSISPSQQDISPASVQGRDLIPLL